jgi:hypothetical protein
MDQETKIQVLKGNRHPVDRLADIRGQIKKLGTAEAELRGELIASPQNRRGDEWVAKVIQKDLDRYDLAAIVKHYGTAALEQFKSNKSVTYVKLQPQGGK